MKKKKQYPYVGYLIYWRFYRHYGAIFSLLESWLAMQETKHNRKNLTQHRNYVR